MKIIKLWWKLFYRACMMFFVGEKFRNIKLACIVDYANYFHEKKMRQKAIEYYRRALRINSDDYYANIGLAGALVMNKMFKESLIVFEKANSLKKPSQVVLLLMFVAYKALDKAELQEKTFTEIKASCNNNEIAAYEGLWYACFELAMYDEAEFYLKQAINNYPDEPGYYYNLGTIYFAQGKHREARNEFQKALGFIRGKQDSRLNKCINYYIKQIDRGSIGGQGA